MFWPQQPKSGARKEGLGTHGTPVRRIDRYGQDETPLIFRFTPEYLYEWDEPRRGSFRKGDLTGAIEAAQ